jgi:hypothetical protein
MPIGMGRAGQVYDFDGRTRPRNWHYTRLLGPLPSLSGDLKY